MASQEIRNSSFSFSTFLHVRVGDFAMFFTSQDAYKTKRNVRFTELLSFSWLEQLNIFSFTIFFFSRKSQNI